MDTPHRSTVNGFEEFFSRNAAVSHLDEITARNASRMARIVSVKAGDTVCFQGDGESPLIFILSGQLHVSTMSEDGEEEALFFADSGGTVGAAPILQGVAIPANVVATKNGQLALLNRASVTQLLSDSQFLLGLSRAISAEALAIAKRRGALGVRSSRARVAATLLSMMDASGSDQTPIIDSPGTEMIDRLCGVSRETVSRVLSSLERSGTISKNGRRLHVLDLDGFQQIAAGRG